MGNYKRFFSRIRYSGNLSTILNKVIEDYEIGKYKNHKLVTVGYEDFNLSLKTDKGNYFVKIFANKRDVENCKRYVNIMLHAVNTGVNHPGLYKSSKSYLHISKHDGVDIRLCVMDYIDGKSFYQLQRKPNKKEVINLVSQAARINKIKIKPTFVYDEWAVVNFLNEFDDKKKYLELNDFKLIDKLAQEFGKIDIKTLLHCFVHGDIINTNVIHGKNNKLYIIDFSVANIYPRIQELAVISCDILFDENNPSYFESNYNIALAEYQKITPLTDIEIRTLPVFIKTAHAMHVLITSYEKKVNNDKSEENLYWLNIGRVGLNFTSKFWR